MGNISRRITEIINLMLNNKNTMVIFNVSSYLLLKPLVNTCANSRNNI